MQDLYQKSIINQYEAALAMVSACVEQCPNELWHKPVANVKFSQVVFHTLFYADVYLGTNLDSLYEQPFHQQHAEAFEGYEELEFKTQERVQHYEKPFLNEYLQYCRSKVAAVVSSETEEDLQRDPGFDWLKFPRAEVHVYNIRHIHHHAAQLSLRLRTATGEGIPWIGSGWQKK